MVAGRGRGLTHTQRWWREKKLPEVEETAYELVRGYEARHGSVRGCVFPPELLLDDLGCELVYFAAEERDQYGIPKDAIGALDPTAGLVYVLQGMVTGRDWHTVGEEAGHKVLHATRSPGPGQGRLSMDVPEPDSPRFFCRTEATAYVDGQVEPVWMTREASLFSACVQMPKARYLPAAERRLKEAVLVPLGGREGARARMLEERVAEATRHARMIRDGGWNARNFAAAAPGVFDTHAVDIALDLLAEDHKGQVSKAAQRRRFVELGLVHDAATLVLGPDGEGILPRFEFLFVSERLVKEALSTRGLPA